VTAAEVPGWGGTPGPWPAQGREPHAYARDVLSEAGTCVCGAWPDDPVHDVQAEP
jgi:hypothetical protein